MRRPATSTPMHALLAPAMIKKRDSEHCCLVLYVCESFDEQFSFRALLQSVGSSGQHADAMVFELPDEIPMEDFVDGYATWRGHRFGLYYERSLGYVQFESEDEGRVDELAKFLVPQFRVKGLRYVMPRWLRWWSQ